MCLDRDRCPEITMEVCRHATTHDELRRGELTIRDFGYRWRCSPAGLSLIKPPPAEPVSESEPEAQTRVTGLGRTMRRCGRFRSLWAIVVAPRAVPRQRATGRLARAGFQSARSAPRIMSARVPPVPGGASNSTFPPHTGSLTDFAWFRYRISKHRYSMGIRQSPAEEDDDETLRVEAVDGAVAVCVRVGEMAVRMRGEVGRRVGERQRVRCDIQRVHDAVAVHIAGDQHNGL